MDKIILAGLKIPVNIGITAEERATTQELEISVELECDLSRAGHSDDLCDSIDYTVVEEGIANICFQAKFLLLEKLAETIATFCLEQSGVSAAVVGIEKNGVLKYGKKAAIQIRRSLANES